MVELSLGTVSTIFLVLGILLLMVEAASPGFFVGIPGTILVILGLFALVVPDEAVFTFWAPIIAIVVALPATAFTVWAYKRIAPAAGPPVTMAAETLVGQRGKTTAHVLPDSTRGKVKVAGQVWSATADAEIPAGETVEVLEVRGVTLVVRRVGPSGAAADTGLTPPTEGT